MAFKLFYDTLLCSKQLKGLNAMKSWPEDKGLKLAMEKTELIFLMKKCVLLEIDITICNTTLTTRKVINYLGWTLD